MLALQYASGSCRGDLVVQSTQLVSRMTRSKQEGEAVTVMHSGVEHSSEQTRLLFSEGTRPVFAEPSPFGVDRNVTFHSGDVDQSGTPTVLPMELPAAVGEAGEALPAWAREVWERARAGVVGRRDAAL